MAVEVIEFTDGSVAPINVHVNALTMLNLQHEGVIGKDFLKGLLNQDEGFNPPLESLAQAVYVAYRNGNPQEHMSYDDFLTKYEMSMEVDIEIYSALITKEGKKAFSQNFIKKTTSGNGKK